MNSGQRFQGLREPNGGRKVRTIFVAFAALLVAGASADFTAVKGSARGNDVDGAGRGEGAEGWRGYRGIDQARPSREELERGLPLAISAAAVGEARDVRENRRFLAAVQSLENWRRVDRFPVAERFLEDFPDSAWRPALLANLGRIYYEKGYFSKAVEVWEETWLLTLGETDEQTMRLAEDVGVELASLYARLGRRDELRNVVAILDRRSLTGPITERFELVREALSMMYVRPEASFKCGPYALAAIMDEVQERRGVERRILEAESPIEGFSLAEVFELSEELEMELQMAKREVGAEVIAPAVVHWRSNHYAALLGEDRPGRYFVRDATFGRSFIMTEAALDNEGSGYFLVPKGELPDGWRPVEEPEAATVFGKGAPWGSSREDSCEELGDNQCPDGRSPGMPSYSFSAYRASLIVRDTPIFYAAASDTTVDFTLAYNHRTFGHFHNWDLSHLGPKWTMNWLSYITYKVDEDENSDKVLYEISYNTGVGRNEVHFTDYDSVDAVPPGDLEGESGMDAGTLGNGGHTLPADPPGSGAPDEFVLMPHHVSQARITYVQGTRFIREGPDGTRRTYETLMEGPIGGHHRALLTSVKTPGGILLTLNYEPKDNGHRLLSIGDNTGGTSYFQYDDPGDEFRITGIKDRYDREVEFEYGSDGMLVKITDLEDMQSTFSYKQNDFMSSMATPYGTTSFDNTPERWDFEWAGQEDGSEIQVANQRVVTAVDPLGRRERVEYMTMGDYVENAAPEEEVPTSEKITVINQDFSMGITLYWDRKTYADFAPNPATGENYEKAMQMVWLWQATSVGFGTTSPHLHSIKGPLGNRAWFEYSDVTTWSFSGPGYRGPMNRPVVIGRVVDHGEGVDQIYELEYNSFGNVTSFTDPVGRTTEITYADNEIDIVKVEQISAGGVTIAEYGNYGNHLPGSYTDTSGGTINYSYNNIGQVTSISNQKNEQTVFLYDSRPDYDPDIHGSPNEQPGFLARITDSGTNESIQFGYDGYGRVAKRIDSEGHTIEFEHDDLSRLTKVIYPDETFEEIVYDRINVAAVRDREGRWTEYFHNAGGQLRLVRDPEGRVTEYDWCNCGDLNSITDAEGNTTRWRYDIAGRLTRKIYPDQTEVVYGYEETTGRLRTVTDALGQVKTYSYYLDDRLKSIEYTDTVNPISDVTFEYDGAFGRLEKMTDALGTTDFDYHPLSPAEPGAGMLSKITFPYANAATIEYGYDALGRVDERKVDGSANVITWDHDSLGRLVEEINPLGKFDFNYVGGTHRLDDIVYPNQQVADFDYHGDTDDHRLKEIAHIDGQLNPISTFSYTYETNGMIKTWTQQEGTASPHTFTFGYDHANRLRSAVKEDNTQTPVAEWDYRYDRADNRRQESLDGQPVEASYNELNQIESLGSAASTRFYGELNEGGVVRIEGEPADMGVNDEANPPVSTFEAWLDLSPGIHQVEIEAEDYSGNITQETYEVNVSSSGDPWVFTYDANGNMTKRERGSEVIEYEWDAADRLIAIDHDDGTRSEFVYDGFGRRVWITEKNSSGGTITDRYYLWDGLEIIEKRDAGTGNALRRYFSLGMEVVTGSDAGDYFYTFDHLGSIREVTNDSGTVVARYDYDPYGRVTQTSGNLERDFLFTGHFYHEKSGLHLAPYRAYDAELGRWLNRDPLFMAELLPEGPGLYGYVGGDPINRFDRSGLSDFWGPEPPWDPNSEWHDAYNESKRQAAERFRKSRKDCDRGNFTDWMSYMFPYFNPVVRDPISGTGAGVLDSSAELTRQAPMHLRNHERMQLLMDPNRCPQEMRDAEDVHEEAKREYSGRR